MRNKKHLMKACSFGVDLYRSSQIGEQLIDLIVYTGETRVYELQDYTLNKNCHCALKQRGSINREVLPF